MAAKSDTAPADGAASVAPPAGDSTPATASADGAASVAPPAALAAPAAHVAEADADAEAKAAAELGEYVVRVTVTGTRNGEPWPSIGELIELPAHEAADYLGAGYISIPE